MQRDDACCQIEYFDPLQPGLFHHGLELRLIRMHADRFGQIAVGLCIPAIFLPSHGNSLNE